MKPPLFIERFGFTRNEIKILLLLSVTLLVGTLLRYFGSSTKAAKGTDQPFDYSISDSIFQDRSAKPSRGFASTSDSAGSISPSVTATRSLSKLSIININTATKNDLTQLPGIGEVYAERIIIYRADHGPFRTVDELENIPGIGKKKLERIKPLATTK